MALPESLDPDLLRRIELSAVRDDISIEKWIERAVRHELDREDDAAFERAITRAPIGAKPQPLANPPSLRDGTRMSDAVIEDRR